MSENLSNYEGLPSSELTCSISEGIAEISLPNVDLNSEGEPLRLKVTIQKLPTVVKVGERIVSITFDAGSTKMQQMLAEAAMLASLPSREKPRKLMELVRSYVTFAYTDVVDALAERDPELAKWISKHTGLRSDAGIPLTTSQIIDSGHAVCMHLSALLLQAAKAANMQGAYLSYIPTERSKKEEYTTKNVIRRDTNLPLFRNVPVDDDIGGHAWVELLVGENEWMPVDPSTQLVGDTAEGMATFQEANYRAFVGNDLEFNGLPRDVRPNGFRELSFYPGEATRTGIVEINCKPRLKRKEFSFNKVAESVRDKDELPKPTDYQGPLNFSILTGRTTDCVTVAVKNVQVSP